MTPEQEQAVLGVLDAIWNLDEEEDQLTVLTKVLANLARNMMDRCECTDEDDVAAYWDNLATKAFSAVTILENVIKEF